MIDKNKRDSLWFQDNSAAVNPFLCGTNRKFQKSPSYEHMKFKEVEEDFIVEMKKNLLKCFQDEESYGFLKDDERWQRLVK